MPQMTVKDQALNDLRRGSQVSSSLAAIGRVDGIPAGDRLFLGQKARQARELMLGELRRRKQRLKPARVMAFDEMWTYVKARRKGKRREVWVWTAVVDGSGHSPPGSRWDHGLPGGRPQ